jgi:hypothetical protein
MSKRVTIVPGRDSEGNAVVQGTKVLLPDGSAIPGVRKITLVAEAGGLWNATIELVASIVDVTNIDSTEMEFSKAFHRPEIVDEAA